MWELLPLFRSKAEDKVRDAGYDPARLPPGQYLTEKWPVLHAGASRTSTSRPGTARHRLVEEPITLELRRAAALPATEVTTDIHCVTRWSRFDARFQGVHWRELARSARRSRPASFVVAHAEPASPRTSRSPRSRDDTRSSSTRPTASP